MFSSGEPLEVMALHKEQTTLLAFWVLVSMLLFEHCGAFSRAQLDYLVTWAGASKVMTADNSAVCMLANFTWVSWICTPTPSKCPEKNRTFPMMGKNKSTSVSTKKYGLCPALLLNSWEFGHLLCCHKARNLDTLNGVNGRGNEAGSSLFPSLLPQRICSYLRN